MKKRVDEATKKMTESINLLTRFEDFLTGLNLICALACVVFGFGIHYLYFIGTIAAVINIYIVKVIFAVILSHLIGMRELVFFNSLTPVRQEEEEKKNTPVNVKEGDVVL